MGGEEDTRLDDDDDDDGDGDDDDDAGDEWGGLNEKQRAVLAYTDAMTVGVRVGEGVFARVRRRFGESGGGGGDGGGGGL